MWVMRLRLRELMNREGSTIRTAYALAKATGLSATNAYHMVKAEGRVERVELATLEALCAAFGVTPNELLAPDNERPWPTPAAPAVRKRGGKGKRAAA